MSHWLVIPLAADLHSIGPLAIDGAMGVDEWERRLYPQAELVDWVGDQLGYSLWQRHARWVHSINRST
jgi:hypothetical protein